jgi:hypothetical protein
MIKLTFSTSRHVILGTFEFVVDAWTYNVKKLQQKEKAIWSVHAHCVFSNKRKLNFYIAKLREVYKKSSPYFACRFI